MKLVVVECFFYGEEAEDSEVRGFDDDSCMFGDGSSFPPSMKTHFRPLV